MLPQISREKQLGILRKMLMIRRAEEHVIRFNEDYEGLIRGHRGNRRYRRPLVARRRCDLIRMWSRSCDHGLPGRGGQQHLILLTIEDVTRKE